MPAYSCFSVVQLLNLFLALSHLLVTTASAQIQRQQPEKTIKLVVNDPYFYFCGSESCYDVLQLAPTANKTEIKSSYRKLAALYHPDKNGSEEAKARLQVIMKAYKVLMDDGKDSEGNWKLKEKFDHYLTHPHDYYKVSGYHIIKEVPKSDPFVVLTCLVLLICFISYVIQWQKYTSVMDRIKKATMNNSNIKNGGSEETQELYRKAIARYEEKYIRKTDKHGKSKNARMSKDPLFEVAVDEIISENVQDIIKPCLMKVLCVPFNLSPSSSSPSKDA